MVKQTLDAMVDGGKATAAPPLGPALGPLGLNIKQVIDEINRKTVSFNGMQVPIKLVADTDTKEFTVSVGTPPTSALIKSECKLEKGAANAKLEKVADLRIEQVIKISKMKEDDMMGKTLKDKIKEVIGTCRSMGILVEGKEPSIITEEINKGIYDSKIASGKTELTKEELKILEEERKKLQEDLKLKQAEWEKKANAILKELEGKTSKEIKTRMIADGIPTTVIDKLLPKDKK